MEVAATTSFGSPDPVLDQIVAKLKSGLTMHNNNNNKATAIGQQSGLISSNISSAAKLPVVSPVAKKIDSPAAVGGCICMRPLKLVMCEVCGETFRARVSLVCSIHPRALYLQDVKECKGCKQTNKEALKEFDLPLGM